MASPRGFRSLIRGLSLGAAMAAVAIMFLLIVVAPTQAQTFQVIHTFTGGADGDEPFAGVTLGQSRECLRHSILWRCSRPRFCLQTDPSRGKLDRECSLWLPRGQ